MPRTLAANGIVQIEIPSDWYCSVHRRQLTYFEWKNGGCFWCDPSRIPAVPRDKKGKPISKWWKKRDKTWTRIASMTAEERAGLVSSAALEPLEWEPDDDDDDDEDDAQGD